MSVPQEIPLDERCVCGISSVALGVSKAKTGDDARCRWMGADIPIGKATDTIVEEGGLGTIARLHLPSGHGLDPNDPSGVGVEKNGCGPFPRSAKQ